MGSYLALIIGAVIGSSFRYLFTLFNFSISGLPVSTALVNVIGSSLAGFFLYKFNNTAYIFLYIGLFGSFTTLSSFNIEMFALMHDKLFLKAFMFFLLNIIMSFLFFYLFHILSLKIAD
jgi:CrcB protein